MKTISYNPTVALSILLAAAVSKRHPEATILISSKTGTNFRNILEDEGQNPDGRYAVILLDEDNDEGKALALAISAKYHHFPINFSQQADLANIFGNDKMLIKSLIAEGNLINSYLSSPLYTGEIEGIETEEELEADETTTEDLLHPPHLTIPIEESPREEAPVDFDDFIDPNKDTVVPVKPEPQNIDGVSEAGDNKENSDVEQEEEINIVDKNIDSHIDDVSIQEEQPAKVYSAGVDPYATDEPQDTSSVEKPAEEKPVQEEVPATAKKSSKK